MIYLLTTRITSRPERLIHHLFHLLAHLGGFGLLIMSFMDSSPLVIPFGNDLLLIGMTASHHALFAYYVLMATAGSVLGSLVVDALSRKGGEKGLEKLLPQKRLNYVKNRIKQNAAWALGIGALVPPPFPFTGFVAGAAALQYPRKRLLIVIAVSRLARFLIEAALGILLGRKLLRLATSPVVVYPVIGLIVLSIVISVLAVLTWVKRGRVSTVAS